MVAQTVFNFKFKRTEKTITPHGGIPFFVRYINGLGLIGLANTYMAMPGSARGYTPAEYVIVFCMLQITQQHYQRFRKKTGTFLKKLTARMNMPCGTFKANAVFFRLGILSYNLFVGFKRLCCPKDWHTHTVKTFRWRLFNTAGQVVRHARQVIVRLKIDRELLRVFEYISRQIDILRMDLSS